ncbi:MAG TPA: DUF4136 domain-containing protein [Gemmatimonadaceae bacterium]|nr:DUF4136 domain-containing protein [Gemmatimonadaceae bacterium]
MRTNRILITAALAACAAAAGACAPAVTVGVSSASTIKPAAYRTYTWVVADEFPTGDPRLDSNPIFVETLRTAIGAELKRLGLEPGGNDADLTVHFHATVQQAYDVYDVDRRAGYAQPGFERAPQVRQFDEGTVVVDVSDRVERRVIWRGWMQTDLSGAIGNDAVLAERVQRGMKELFAKFPAQCVCKGD